MMNCNKQYTIKVTEGNAFGLLLQLKSRTFQSSVPIDEDIDATHLEDIVIKVNNESFTDFTVDESGVLMNIPADMAVGTYNVELTGSYYDVEIRAGYFQCFSIVPWSYQSDAVNYIPGSPIATEAAYVVVGIIDDQELEDLKAELRLKIAAAEAAKEAADQAKEDFDEKAEALDNLDNVAQQGTNPDATLSNTQTAAQGAALNSQIARGYIGTPQSGQPNTLFGAIANINIDTSTIAQRTDVKDGNDTAISVAKEIRSEVGTGSDTAAESGTLFAILKWVKDKVKSIGTDYAKQGSDSTATNTALLSVLNSISTNMYKGVPVVTQTTSATISPNVWNVWSSAVGAITITKGSDISGVVNEYMIRFVASSSTAITFSGWSLTWYGGSVPTWEDGKTYEINIVDNLAIWAVFG